MTRKEILTQSAINRIRQGNGFDAIRYFFAFALIAFHFTVATGTTCPWYVPGGDKVVMAFFVIAGFLVVYSYLRNDNLKHYVRQRCVRILPAYVFVVVAAFLFLSLVSSFSISRYFSHPQAYKYLVSNLLMLNFLEPDLPGVFTANPLQCVNGSLWYIKVIVMFYIAVPVIVWMLRRMNKALVLTLLYAASVAYIVVFDHLYESTGNILYWQLQHQLGGNMIYLLSGTIMLVYFDCLIRHIKWILPLALILFIAYDQFGVGPLRHVAPLSFAAVIIGIAFVCKPLFALRGKTNITYSLFLIHFPVIQIVVHFGWHQQSMLFAFCLALLATIALSILSHHLIEKPFLHKP